MNISGFVKEEVFERKDLDYDNFLCLYFSYLFNLEKNKYEWWERCCYVKKTDTLNKEK
jgi:hypothetical protein